MQACATSLIQYNAASGEMKTQGSEVSELRYAFHPLACDVLIRVQGGHGQCDEAGFSCC